MANEWDGPDMAAEVRLPGIGSETSVLITGGTGAIGYHVAECFLRLGARVGVMSRSARYVRECEERLRLLGDAVGVAGDVASPAEGAAAVETVLRRFGRLDVLVNAAAVGGNRSLFELDEQRIDATLAVNVKGSLLMAKAAALAMRDQGRGRIVNVASIAAHRSTTTSALYGASKAAVVHLTQALAVELGPLGITVNCVSPASTPSSVRDVDDRPGTPPAAPSGGGGRSESIPIRRRGELGDYAGPILFLASDLAGYLTGAELLADGGLAVVRT